MRIKWSTVWLLVPLVALHACDDETIPLPSADATNPSGYWVVAPARSGVQPPLYGTDAHFDLGSEKEVTVVFHVDDRDGGVERVAVDGGGLSACPKSNVDDIAVVTCRDALTLTPNANNEVAVHAMKGCSLDLSCKRKAGDLIPQVVTGPGGTFVFSGEGENYHGGKVSSRLTLTTTPE